MTESKLSHTVDHENHPRGPGSANYGGVSDNPSSAQGASNPAIGGDKVRQDGPAQEIAGTLPADFSLKGMKAEYKGEDKTEPHSDLSGTAGRGGDSNHTRLQNHEVDLPDTPDRSRPRENIGDNSRH